MKYFILLALSLSYIKSSAQLSDPDLNKIKSQIETESKTLKVRLTKNASDIFFIEFQLDTFKIERGIDLKNDLDYPTLGMIQATNQAIAEYDILLNKYYKLLLSKLEPHDKVILQEAQRNWIKFRDSEVVLINLMSEDKYSGGGTIQGVIDSDAFLKITRSRVFELANHLTRN